MYFIEEIALSKAEMAAGDEGSMSGEGIVTLIIFFFSWNEVSMLCLSGNQLALDTITVESDNIAPLSTLRNTRVNAFSNRTSVPTLICSSFAYL